MSALLAGAQLVVEAKRQPNIALYGCTACVFNIFFSHYFPFYAKYGQNVTISQEKIPNEWEMANRFTRIFRNSALSLGGSGSFEGILKFSFAQIHFTVKCSHTRIAVMLPFFRIDSYLSLQSDKKNTTIFDRSRHTMSALEQDNFTICLRSDMKSKHHGRDGN